MDDDEAAEWQQSVPYTSKYEGEDLTPTTDREIKGFYCYSIAAEVFAVCGVGSFLPVTLEQLARERGVLWSDKTTSCIVKKTMKEGAHPTALLAFSLARRTEPENHQCVVRILGIEVTTSSFAMYTFSIAVFIQALALISFSSVADYGNYRKKLLLGFGITGAVSSMLFILVFPRIFIVGSFLVIIGVTCLGSSFVILNSFLPLLVANHPLVRNSNHNADVDSVPLRHLHPNHQHGVNPEVPTTPTQLETDQRRDSAKLNVSNMISSRGVGIGYVAAVFVQVLSIIILFLMSKTSVSSTIPLRMVLFLVGTWWLAFTIPSSLWLRDRPGPPLQKLFSGGSKLRSCFAYTSFAWVSVWKTIKVVSHLREAVTFLLAWFLLSDAIATVSGTAILFARTELKMGTIGIAVLSITATSSGIAGAFVWPIISRKFGLRTNRTIVACIGLMEVIPLYGLLGYVPFIKSWGVGGLQQVWEIYPLGIIHGFVMGGLSSYCRSFFGLLIPPGSEAAFYALYAITDKGSSAIGPAIVGLIVDRTGEIRLAFAFLAILIALPAPLVWMVDVERGQRDATQMAATLNKTVISREIDEPGDIQEAAGLMRDHD